MGNDHFESTKGETQKDPKESQSIAREGNTFFYILAAKHVRNATSVCARAQHIHLLLRALIYAWLKIDFREGGFQ